MHRNQLDTPSLILDLNLFERNLAAMRDHAAACGKKLRPHAKTHKCPEIARRRGRVCAGLPSLFKKSGVFWSCRLSVRGGSVKMKSSVHDNRI